MATMLDDIIQALRNLGGQATLKEIYAEVERIRTSPLPKTWHASIRGRIEDNSSDSESFKGKDYFRKVGKGTWALRDQDGLKKPPPIRQVSEPKKQEVFSQFESLETISNSLKTIKQYREYADPGSPSWIDYVQEIFHIMGFNTQKKDARLILLRDMSGDNTPKAIVVYMFPNENHDEVGPGVPWETYLRFASNYHQIEWGILTNGLQLRIINYGNHKDQPALFWSDLDGIVKNHKVDSFFAIYKAFSTLKAKKEEPEQSDVSRQGLRLEFWKGLLDRAKILAPKLSKFSPSKENWFSIGAGKTGFNYAFVIRMNNAHVEIYIDSGDAIKNKQVFDTLSAHRGRIERGFGKELDWQRLDEKRACRIRYLIEDFGLVDVENWPELQTKMIEAMLQLQKAFKPEIGKLR
jgi:hypothetical protein